MSWRSVAQLAAIWPVTTPRHAMSVARYVLHSRGVRPITKPIIAVVVVLLTACGTPAQTQTQTPTPTQTAQPPTGTLETLLAPIALYPDSLLAQMLMSATDPAKVTELDKWMKSNATLKGTQLQDAAVKAGFDASYVALVLFPQVVSKMAEQIAWTRLLGQTFESDRSGVFATIQKLRKQAQTVGTLKSSPQQQVETKTTSAGEQVIVIEPTNPQIVYVPQYNTQVVYTQAPTTTTVIVQEDDDDDDAAQAMAAGLIGFTAGIAIGAAMDSPYYYGPYGWHGGGYMYNDAWDDYYDHREDAREDWIDHREDLVEERSDRLEDQRENRSDRVENTQQQRTDRAENRQENRPETQAQRTERAAQAQGAASTYSANEGRAAAAEARSGSSGSRAQPTTQRGSSDAFGGYSSGSSQRASSARGQQSRKSSGGSRSGGGRRR